MGHYIDLTFSAPLSDQAKEILALNSEMGGDWKATAAVLWEIEQPLLQWARLFRHTLGFFEVGINIQEGRVELDFTLKDKGQKVDALHDILPYLISEPALLTIAGEWGPPKETTIQPQSFLPPVAR